MHDEALSDFFKPTQDLNLLCSREVNDGATMNQYKPLARYVHAIIAASLILLAATSAVWGEAESAVSNLKGIIAQRLMLMPAVASYKWRHGLDIEDLEREAELLNKMVAQARAAGLTDAYAEQVIAAQMQSAKTVQTRFVTRWQTHPAEAQQAPAHDLVTVVRPQISALTAGLIQLLGEVGGSITCDDLIYLREMPDDFQLGRDVWRIATDSLAPATLECP